MATEAKSRKRPEQSQRSRGRQEFERQMERRRLEALDEEALKPLRQSWQKSEWATRQRNVPG